jgi:hypothetical protein
LECHLLDAIFGLSHFYFLSLFMLGYRGVGNGLLLML